MRIREYEAQCSGVRICVTTSGVRVRVNTSSVRGVCVNTSGVRVCMLIRVVCECVYEY